MEEGIYNKRTTVEHVYPWDYCYVAYFSPVKRPIFSDLVTYPPRAGGSLMPEFASKGEFIQKVIGEDSIRIIIFENFAA